MKFPYLVLKISVSPTRTNHFQFPHEFPNVLKKEASCQYYLTQVLLLFGLYAMSNSFMIPWTVACQAPLSMGFSRQEYWSRLPFPTPEDFHKQGNKPKSPELAGGFFTAETPGKPPPWFGVWKFTILQ